MTIKELRKTKKLSQAAFAAELGIAAVTVSQLETGRMKLSPKMAARVKDIFGEDLEAAPEKETPAEKPDKASKPAKAPKTVKESKPVKAPRPAKATKPDKEPKPAKAAKPAEAPKLEIYVQSPYGGNITPEEIAAKMPEGTESCFVRVDQNLIWWVRANGETGAVEIWNDRA